MAAAGKLAERVGVAAACEALGVPRASHYRSQARARSPAPPLARPRPPLALSQAERFKGRMPRPRSLPAAVRINLPGEQPGQQIVQPAEDLP